MKKLCLIFSLFSLAATTWAGELRCLRPGAPVISLYRDNRYFPGRVDGLGESIDVTFRNGLQQTYSSFTNDVIVDDIPDPSELAGGSRVLARRPSSTSFEPGFVNGSIEGLPLNNTYLVNYDTGDSIARNIGDIRLAVKPRSCMNEKGIYIGCFENVVNNFLTNYYPVNPTDVATCNWACFTRGFRFAGLQNGTWCFCGNHVNDSLKVDDNDCNIACRDSREDVCGGYQRMTVYWTGVDYSDNTTNDLSEFADTADQLPPDQDVLKSETSTEKECSDLHDSTQCNIWADQSKCIENPDWMLVNCKKSCYACSYDDHSQDDHSQDDHSQDDHSQDYHSQDTSQDTADSSTQAYTPVSSAQAQSQSQVNPYQTPAQTGYQASASYAQSPYLSQDASVQSSSKKSDHPVLDSKSNIPGYLGCFKDSPSSHDLEYLADIRPLSIRACVTKCKSMRFPYAGVQSTTLCYCGLHYGKYGQLEHEDCNTPCEADASEMCGGIFKNSLYHTGFPVKFKSSENALTRKDLASPTSAVERPLTSNDMATYSPNPSYSSRIPQPSYPSYNPPVYHQPSSPYTQAAIAVQPSYSQAPTNQENRYQPAYSYNTQANNPLQAGTSTTNADTRDYSPVIRVSNPLQAGTSKTNADTRDYSPVDSSAYRWRETYVKLRQQEQERYSKPTLRNLRRLQKKGSTWSEIPGNSFREHQKKTKAKDSSKFQTIGNYLKPLPSKESQTHSVKSSGTLASRVHSPGKSLYKQFVSQVYKNSRKSNSRENKRILQKGARRHKHLGKPGVFLRKKASNKSSFLAFLPHEVTEDESLLENVYNMLSVMLKNLRKHRKSSMKTLKKYLKLSSNEEDMSKLRRKAPIHNSEGQKSEHDSEKSFEHKFRGLDIKDRGSSQHFETAQKHPSEGQKQLSKQAKEISNSQRSVAQTMTYTSHDVPRVRPDVNQSFPNENSAAHQQTADEAKSTVNSNKEDSHYFINKIQTEHNDIGEISLTQLSKNVSSNAPQLQTTLASTLKRPRGRTVYLEALRNNSEVVASNEYQKPMVNESKLENHRPLSAVDKKAPMEYNNNLSKSSQISEQQNMLRFHENTTGYNGQEPSKVVKIGNTFEQNMKEESSFTKSEETKNVSLDSGKDKVLKAVSPKEKYTKGDLEKPSKKNLPSSKIEGRTRLKIDEVTAKNQTDGENIVETSDDDIISTIVDLLDHEKALRKMKDQKKERKRNDRKRNQRVSKRKNKKHQKRKRKDQNKERKHKVRTVDSKHDKLKGSHSRKIYKKDHMERVNEDDSENNDENLMEQEEDFQEDNKMNEW